MSLSVMRLPVVFALIATLAACGGKPDVAKAPPVDPRYPEIVDGGQTIEAIHPGYLTERNARTTVPFTGTESAGAIVVDPFARVLYHVNGDGTATRYGIAVGREGLGFRGDARVNRKEVWPSWTPTANMVRREPEVYGPYAGGLPGGIENPLGARALYLYRGGKDTHYRIHGTNNASTIGRATSAGCIRLFNQDAIDLFDKVETGTSVHVRTFEESLAIEGELVEDENGYMVALSSLPEDVQAQIRAGITPWPKFVPIVGVNASAPVLPTLPDGTTPPAPGT